MWAQRVMLRYEYSSRQGCMALVRQLQNINDHRKCCLRGLVLLKRSRDARRRQVAIRGTWAGPNCLPGELGPTST